MDKSQNMFLRILDIFTHFFLLNVIWIVCSLPIVTFFPATTAMFAVVRKWVSEGIEEVGFFHIFFKQFKANFKKSFIIGLFWLIAGYLLYFDISILTQFDFTGRMVVLVIAIFVSIIYLFTTIYTFLVLVNYELSIIHTLKNALFISISYFFYTVLFLIIIGIAFVFIYYIPFLILIAGSVVAFSLYSIFDKITIKIQRTRAEQ